MTWNEWAANCKHVHSLDTDTEAAYAHYPSASITSERAYNRNQ